MNDGSEIDERRRARLLAAEPGQVPDDFAGPAALRLEQRNLLDRLGTEMRIALEELRRAENRLQRIVQLVGDPGDQQTDRGEPLLPDHLPLKRLDHLAHLPFLLHLAIERVARGPEVGGHRDEGVLQLGDLQVRRPGSRRRRQIAARDPLGRGANPLQAGAGVMRHPAATEPSTASTAASADREVSPPQSVRGDPRQRFAGCRHSATTVPDRRAPRRRTARRHRCPNAGRRQAAGTAAASRPCGR